MSADTVHRNTLEEEARHILEECRVVTPGIQALIGFQMIVVFNSAFEQKLDASMRDLHLGAMGVVLVAMFLLLTRAAYHRVAEPGEVSKNFVDSSTRLMCWAMAFLRLGLAAEMHVVGRALGLPTPAAAGLAGFFFLLSYALWSVYPRVSAMRRAPRVKSG